MPDKPRFNNDVSRPPKPVPEDSDALKLKKSRKSKRTWLVRVIIVGAVVLIGFLTYGYITTRNQLTDLNRLKDPSKANSQQLVDEIGQYLELPNETPTLATVSDVTKLQEQEFFKNAKNGDRVLIFTKTGRALIYRPSTHKVIEYSRVDTGATQSQ